MKKIIPALLLTAALLSLAACGRSAGPSVTPTPGPSATPSNDELAIMAASDTDAAASVQTHVPPASSTDLQIDGEAYDKAAACVGKTIFELYSAIGQPQQTPVYVPSSVQQDAQEGTLVYKGFNVYTMRTSAEEIIQGIEITVGMDTAAQDTAGDAAGDAAAQDAAVQDAAVQDAAAPAAEG